MPLKIIRNDLLQMEVDAIVNPTDTRLSGSGSIDSRIHQAGQAPLKEELAKIGRCNVGDAILTNAYNLSCRYIIFLCDKFSRCSNLVYFYFKKVKCCFGYYFSECVFKRKTSFKKNRYFIYHVNRSCFANNILIIVLLKQFISYNIVGDL